jgi:hypothetical protein
MNTLRRRVVAITIALPLLALVWFIPHAGNASGTGMQPLTAAVNARQTIEFRGIGFIPNERVSIWATAPDQSVLGGEFFGANGVGEVAIRFRVPQNALGGTWALTAFGDQSRQPAIAEFAVNGQPQGVAAITGAVEPGSGPAGTRFFFFATGYRDRETVSYWITGPDGAIVAAYPSGAKANGDGRVDINWVSHTGAHGGIYVVTIQGLRSGVARGIPFEIR